VNDAAARAAAVPARGRANQRAAVSPFRSLLATLAVATAALGQIPAPAPTTFTEHVAPLVFESCAHCHRPGEAAPFPLLTYADVKKRGRNLLRVVEERYMPPWHPAPGYGAFRHDPRLSDTQITTLRRWVEGGMPEGPADKLPKPPAFPAGWQLGEPDLVLTTSGAFEVPASGRDIYRNFAVKVGLPEDQWITAIEVRPSARTVLHHVLIFLDENGEGSEQEGTDGRPGFSGMRLQRAPLLAGWAVGGMPEHLPDGLALKLPKGSDLLLQSHLHPSGKKEKEQTTIGLYFAKTAPKRTLVTIQLPPFFGITAGLDIPPNERAYRLTDSFELPCDVLAVTVGGHAHQLCTSMTMFAEKADGDPIPLLKIPAWDFDWQNRYTFREMVKLPKGSVIRSELVYDNSKDNPNNPNQPPKRVRWGRETTDEMGSISLMVVPADEADLGTLQAAIAKKNVGKIGAQIDQAVDERFAQFDTDRDGMLTKNEVPQRLRMFFESLDKDGNGKLTKDEAKGLTELIGRGLGGLPGAPGPGKKKDGGR